MNSLYRYQPLRRVKQSLRRSKQSLRRSNQSLQRSNQSLQRQNQSLRRQNQLLQRTMMIQPDLSHHECTRQHVSVLMRKQNNMKQKQFVHKYIKYVKHIPHTRHSPRHSHNKRYQDREPSRVPLKNIILAMRKRQIRQSVKQVFLKSTPKSSILNRMSRNFKEFCFKFVRTLSIFTRSFVHHFKQCLNFCKFCQSTDSAEVTEHFLPNISRSQNRINNSNAASKQYVCAKKLLLSGDIETNPGPVYTVLEERLQQFQLRPFDVGGEGDCFFRAVSHQLYGDPSHHIEIREAGILHI